MIIIILQFSCGGMILEEEPGKLVEAFRLFLQGFGYGKTWQQVNNSLTVYFLFI